mgnify:CR=1 FL=1|jgi:putative tricarboxylic transport membrane protein
MKKANLVSGILLLIFSLVMLFWLIPTQVEEAFDGQVSPQLLPQICAGGIGLLSLVLIFMNFSAFTEAGAKDAPPALSWLEVRAWLIITSMLAVCIFVFTLAGPIVACTLLVGGVLFAMGERRIVPYIVIPAVLLTSSYFMFYKLLGTAIV